MERSVFEQAYAKVPPWEIGRPQPALIRLAEAGRIHGRVLDVGCGTGDNAIYLAERGYEVVGIDFVESAIFRAKEKAALGRVALRFELLDALQLDRVNERFDTVIDSGLFHTFTDAQRAVFINGLEQVISERGTLFMLCFSEQEPGGDGPRRVTQQEIRESFGLGWKIEAIEASRYAVREGDSYFRFSTGGAYAWFSTIRRVNSS